MALLPQGSSPQPHGTYYNNTERTVVSLEGIFPPRKPPRKGSPVQQFPTTSPRQLPALCPACVGPCWCREKANLATALEPLAGEAEVGLGKPWY